MVSALKSGGFTVKTRTEDEMIALILGFAHKFLPLIIPFMPRSLLNFIGVRGSFREGFIQFSFIFLDFFPCLSDKCLRSFHSVFPVLENFPYWSEELAPEDKVENHTQEKDVQYLREIQMHTRFPFSDYRAVLRSN